MSSKEAAADPLIGTVMQGRYQITRLLGKGGMGSVYLADQLSIGRPVAIKVLHGHYAQDEEFIARFRHEARNAAALNHHRVVVIYEFGQAENGGLFIAMEYVDGQTLKKLIQQGPLPVERAVGIGRQVAEGLAAAHRVGVIHRDVKPENIMVRDDDQVKLMDFGIARMQDAHAQTRLTRAGLIVGTPEYMAPEQIDGAEVTAQTDLYAWGIVMYEMLRGETPFTAPTPAKVLLSQLKDDPLPLRALRPEVPQAVEDVVMRALAKDPRKRQEHMKEVIAALQSVAAAADKGAEELLATMILPPPPPSPLPRAIRAWGVPAGALLGAGAAIAAIVWGIGLLEKDPVRGLAPQAETARPAAVPTPATLPEPVVSRPVAPPTLPLTPPVPGPEAKLSEPKVGPPAPQKSEPKVKPSAPEVKPSTPQKEAKEHTPAEAKPDVSEHLRVGQFYADRGQYEDAITELEAAKKADPGNAEVVAALARVRRAQDAERSIQLRR